MAQSILCISTIIKKIPCCSFLCMCGADKFIDINIDLLSNFIVYVSNVCTLKNMNISMVKQQAQS